MEWLNYHHLLYFWVVRGGERRPRPSEELRLAQPTISGQIQRARGGARREALRPQGPTAGADRVGQVASTATPTRSSRWGASSSTRSRDARPDGRCGWSSASRTCCPSRSCGAAARPLSAADPVRVDLPRGTSPRRCSPSSRCHGWTSCSPSAGAARRRASAFSHLLGECASRASPPPKLAARLRRKFPRSLDGAPLLLPAGHLRRCAVRFEQWFDAQESARAIVGEFDDSALMKAFGEQGDGCLRGAHRHRRRGPAPVSGRAGRRLGRGARALLCDLGRAPDQAPGGGGDCEAARTGVLKAGPGPA